ncbi:MAG: VWA domain-containing protein [Acidobacteriota bacterium]
MNKKPNIQILTAKSTLESDKEQTVDVLVRITTPANESTNNRRPKINVSLVLDRSGSMSGSKLDGAKDAAKYCVDQLLATDRLSTVIFDDEIDVLIPSQHLENKEKLKRAIASVQANGSTALHQAWVRGGLQVSEHIERDAVNRVLLITDGQANVGETNVDRIVEQTAALAAKGVTTSTIGIGADFNEDLLMPMAEAGQGNAWHVQEPQDMVKIFATELQGLVNQIGHRVRLNVKPAERVTVAEVLNDFETDKALKYKLPDLRAGSSLDVVFRLRVPRMERQAGADMARFDLEYVSHESGVLETVSEIFAVDFDTMEVVNALSEDLDVAAAAQLLINARARREAMAQLDRGEYAASVGTLKSVAASSQALFSAMPDVNFDLMNELDDLKKVTESLHDRGQDVMSRKQMAYRRESLRKSK